MAAESSCRAGPNSDLNPQQYPRVELRPISKMRTKLTSKNPIFELKIKFLACFVIQVDAMTALIPFLEEKKRPQKGSFTGSKYQSWRK